MIQVATEKKTVRCAIYVRKSHEEGLEQEFNSWTPNGRLAKRISPASGMRAG